MWSEFVYIVSAVLGLLWIASGYLHSIAGGDPWPYIVTGAVYICISFMHQRTPPNKTDV